MSSAEDEGFHHKATSQVDTGSCTFSLLHANEGTRGEHQTDALLEQILGDRAKLEHSPNRVHAHTSHFAQQQPTSSATSEEAGPIDYPNHTTETKSERELSWGPWCVDDDGYLLVDENGSTVVPVPRDEPLDEPEASSLSAWAQGYREVRKNRRDSITGRR